MVIGTGGEVGRGAGGNPDGARVPPRSLQIVRHLWGLHFSGELGLLGS